MKMTIREHEKILSNLDWNFSKLIREGYRLFERKVELKNEMRKLDIEIKKAMKKGKRIQEIGREIDVLSFLINKAKKEGINEFDSEEIEKYKTI